MANLMTAAAHGATTQTSTQGKKDCKFCQKQGCLVLPLRYGTAPIEAKDSPDLPAHLNKKDICGIDLKKSKYVLRTLRDGYLYVFVKKGALLDVQAYAASGNGYLYQFPPSSPPEVIPAFTCSPTTCGSNASLVGIPLPAGATISSAYFLFSPTALTVMRLTEISTISAMNKLCQTGQAVEFNPSAWVQSQAAQAATLAVEELDKSVAEFALYDKLADTQLRPTQTALFNGPFPPMVAKPADEADQRALAVPHLLRLKTLKDYMRNHKAATVAMPDPIGIAQELNDYRNSALSLIEDVNMQRDPVSGLKNRDRFNILNQIKEIQTTFENGAIRSNAQYRQDQIYDIRSRLEPVFPDDSPELVKLKVQVYQIAHPGTSGIVLASNVPSHPNRVQWATESDEGRRRADTIQKRLAAIDKSHPEKWTHDAARAEWHSKFGQYLDSDVMGKLEKTYEDAATTAIKLAKERTDDHLNWVKDERLVAAFDALFDKKDMLSGAKFQAQALLCMSGMSGQPKCEAQIDQWAAAPTIERENIYMRAFVFNQETLRVAANEAFAEATAQAGKAKDPTELNGQAIFKGFQKFISTLKSIDSAWDEHARNAKQIPDLHKSWTGQKMFQIAEFTRTISRQGITRGETAVAARLGGLLHSLTGSVAQKIGLHELAFRIDLVDPMGIKPDTTKPGYDPRKAVEKRGNAVTTSLAEAQRNRDPSTVANDAQAKEMLAKKAASGKGLTPELLKRIDAVEAAAEKRRQLHGSLAERIKDAIENARSDESAKDGRPAHKTQTNNYHQVRIGVALAGLEMVNLLLYLKKSNEAGAENSEELWRARASALSLGSIVCDSLYAHVKSTRELVPSSNLQLKAAGDIVRGGFKATAGTLAFSAGFIGVVFEVVDFGKEWSGEQRPTKLLLCGAKALVAGATTVVQAAAALSYAGPILQRAVLLTPPSSKIRVALMALASVAEKWAERVALLRWVAKANLAGVILMGLEGIYWGICKLRDGPLTLWCKRSMFASKNTKDVANRYGSAEEEIKALALAIQLEND